MGDRAGRASRGRGWRIALLLLVLAGGGAWLAFSGASADPTTDPSRATIPAEAAPELPSFTSTDETAEVAPAALRPPAPSAPTPTSLRVFATWGRDGSPAARVGLLVRLSGANPEWGPETRQVITDERGEWFGDDMTPGKVYVSFDRWGLGDSIVLAPGQAGELHVAIPPGVLLRGLVTDAAGTPEPEATVVVTTSQFSDDDPQVLARTGADGRFELRDFARAGRYLGARSARHAPSGLTSVNEPEAEAVDVVLVLGGECAAVSGLVLSPDGAPVGGARVHIPLRRTAPLILQTAANGHFLAEGLPLPSVRIVAKAGGFSPAVTGVKLAPGQTADVTLALTLPIRLSGTVRDAAGAPVAGAEVLVGPPSSYDLTSSEPDSMPPLGRYLHTRADGRYEVSGIVAGMIKILVRKDDVGRDSAVLQAEPGQDLVWDAVLGAGTSIAGWLLDADGAPAPGWLLVAVPSAQGEEMRQVRSQADGRFEIRNLGQGPQDIQVMGKSLGNFQLSLAAAVAPGTRDLELRLPAGVDKVGTVSGRVLDAQGQPAASARVTLTNETEQHVPTKLDPVTGRFLAEQLPPGLWHVHVDSPAAPSQDFPPALLKPAGELNLGDLVLTRGGTVAVTVRAPGGVPEKGVTVLLVGKGTLKREGETWRSTPVAPGPHTLVVTSNSHVRVRSQVVVQEGRELELTVELQPGVAQQINLFVEDLLSANEPTPLSVVVRTLDGQVAWDTEGGRLPATGGRATPAGLPTATLFAVLPAGKYLVDVDVGSGTLHGRAFHTSADAPWELRLP